MKYEEWKYLRKCNQYCLKVFAMSRERDQWSRVLTALHDQERSLENLKEEMRKFAEVKEANLHIGDQEKGESRDDL